MGIHKKREESSRAAARLLLESQEPVELPPAELNEEDVTIERETFRPHLPELFEVLREGDVVMPAPLVQSDSVFVVEGDTRSFWIRIWHTDETRTKVARAHVLSCLPHAPVIKVNLGGV